MCLKRITNMYLSLFILPMSGLKILNVQVFLIVISNKKNEDVMQVKRKFILRKLLIFLCRKI